MSSLPSVITVIISPSLYRASYIMILFQTSSRHLGDGRSANACHAWSIRGRFPGCRDSLELRIKLDAIFTVKVRIASKRVLCAREGEERKRNWNWHIDANHPGSDISLVFACIEA